MLIVFPYVFILVIWLVTFYQSIVTAVALWSISEIFTHCFLVIPGAFYLIYKNRGALSETTFKINYWLLLPLSGLLLLQAFGEIGDIRLFMHIAAFVSLPLLIWLVIGNDAARTIAFPLYFMLFAIPIGEALIPFLQELTTDIAVPLLELTNVPVFRNGLYLDIPEGRFLVAEACSGISFLIASIVFGHLYAYLSFTKLYKQIIFVGISIIIPIFANALRVYGIVLTGHLSDMKHAVGADHLIYGGVFYVFLLFLLIFIGEKFREKVKFSSKCTNSGITNVSSKKQQWVIVFCIAVVSFVQQYWVSQVINRTNVVEPNINYAQMLTSENAIYNNANGLWQPIFNGYDDAEAGMFRKKAFNVEFHFLTYWSGKGELVSSTNKLYSRERWSLKEQRVVEASELNNSQYILTTLVSPEGRIRYIAYWYEISQHKFTSKIKAKIFETTQLLLGQYDSSSLIAFSIESSSSADNITLMFDTVISSLNE